MLGITSKLNEKAKENANPDQVKEIAAPSEKAASASRDALDIKNRGLCKTLTLNGEAKHSTQKKLIDLRLRNAVRNAKPRVDTYWKKRPAPGSNTTNAATASTGALLEKKKPAAEVIPNKKIKKEPTEAARPLMPITTTALSRLECIDALDKDNLQLVAEYANDIYEYLFKLEQEKPIDTDRMSGQLEVTQRMRGILIDWVSRVHGEFHMVAETFQIAVGIIDQYLQVIKDTKRTNLQLVGVTALFIATKYEELIPPPISDYVYITDNTYTAKEICAMELRILKAINYYVTRPLPIHFLRRYCKVVGAENVHYTLSKYFVELSTIDCELSSYRPSEIAAGSLFLSLNLLNGDYQSRCGLNNKHWIPILATYSHYTSTHLRPITRLIAKVARSGTKKLAIHRKYQEKKFDKISLRPEISGLLMDSIIAQKK